MSLYFIYKTEKMIDNPISIIRCISKTNGNSIIKIGSVFKITNEVTITINKEGKKLMALAITIDIGIRNAGELDSLIKFLLSTKLVIDLRSES